MEDILKKEIESMEKLSFEIYQIQQGEGEDKDPEKDLNLVVMTLHSFLILTAKISQMSSTLREKGAPDIEAEKLIESAIKDIADFIKKLNPESNDMEA